MHETLAARNVSLTAAGAVARVRSRSAELAAWRLSVIVGVLMAVQSAVGVLLPSVYRDTGWVTAAWYGNDLVTLLVAVPLLAWSLYATRRGSPARNSCGSPCSGTRFTTTPTTCSALR